MPRGRPFTFKLGSLLFSLSPSLFPLLSLFSSLGGPGTLFFPHAGIGEVIRGLTILQKNELKLFRWDEGLQGELSFCLDLNLIIVDQATLLLI